MADKPGPKPLRPEVEANRESLEHHAEIIANLKDDVAEIKERLARLEELAEKVLVKDANPMLSVSMAGGFQRLVDTIRNDANRYRKLLSAAKQLQGSTNGPLTDLVEAIRAG